MYVRECGCIGEGLGGVCVGVGFFAHFASRNPGSSGAWAVARGGGAAATLLLLLFPPPGELKRGRVWVGRLGARAWWPLGLPGGLGKAE